MACCGFCGLNWAHSGNTPWGEISGTCPDGSAGTLLKAGVITANQQSILTSPEFSNVGTLSFWYQVSSEQNFDFLSVYFIKSDGSSLNNLVRASGAVGWTYFEFDLTTLPVDTYRAVFNYTKDGSENAGSDTAWVTGYQVTAPSSATVHSRLTLTPAIAAETDLRESAVSARLQWRAQIAVLAIPVFSAVVHPVFPLRLKSTLSAARGLSAVVRPVFPLRLKSTLSAARGLSAVVRPKIGLRSRGGAIASATAPSSTARFPVWLEIDDAPTVALWREPAASKLHQAPIGWPVLASIGPMHQPLIRPGLGGGESGNVTLTLDDATGMLARRWATPPIRRTARVQCPAGILISGLVTGWTAGARTTVQIDGGHAWALTDPLPLRTSAAWGAWKTVHALPLIYGQAIIKPVQYDQQGKVFLLADHPIAGVDGVTRDDAPTSAWALHNAVDSTGHPCAFLELNTPLAPGERLAVALRGKLHPVTGQALQLPHEILDDLVSRVIGMPLQQGALDLLRAQFADWRIGVVFDDTALTQRQAIDAVCQSIGAAWSAGAADFARLWPDTPDPAQANAEVTPLTARDVQADCRHDAIATVLRVLYDHDHATGQPRRAIQLAAPQAVAQYGRIEREWQAPFLRSPRQAQQLGQRLLQWLARPTWTLTWAMPDQALTAGDTVLLAHPALPYAGAVTLTDVQRDLSKATLTLQAQAASGSAPDGVIERLSSSFDPVISSGSAVEYVNGQAIFTLLGDKGEALAGAKVTLDGKTVRYADGAGRVTFEATRGAHQLHIVATGYAPMDIDVTV